MRQARRKFDTKKRLKASRARRRRRRRRRRQAQKPAAAAKPKPAVSPKKADAATIDGSQVQMRKPKPAPEGASKSSMLEQRNTFGGSTGVDKRGSFMPGFLLINRHTYT